MSLMSEFEDRLGRAVEGMFAGVFRSPVQPAELARACAKEMDKRRKLGVGKVYAPTLYSVLISPADADQLGGFTGTLAGELETYLSGYAAEKGYEFSTRPRVQFLVDDDLKLGRYEIIGELLSAEEIAAELGDEGDGYFDPDAEPMPVREPQVLAAPEGAAPQSYSAGIATVTIAESGHDIALSGERMVLGRLKRCDICLSDANASREHAVFEREGTGWRLVDLGSTNGTYLNGKRVGDPVRLRGGDVITIGVTEIVYNEPAGMP